MILDFQQSLTGYDFTADLIVVGSGPVGLAIASEFATNANIKVLVLESGADKMTSFQSDLNKVISSGDVATGQEGSRARALGGSSTLWGGQLVQFGEIDFQKRGWIEHSGWPISGETIAPHYARAAKFYGVDFNLDTQDKWRQNVLKDKAFENADLDTFYTHWSPWPDLFKRYMPLFRDSRNVDILKNATMTKMSVAQEDDRIESITVTREDGFSLELTAKIIVLCTGGIENARLLLMANKENSNRLGNQEGMVGRYFQDHLGYYGCRLIPKQIKQFQRIFASHFVKDQMYLPRIGLMPGKQISSELLNINGNIVIQECHGASMALKRIFNDIKSKRFNRDTCKQILLAVSQPAESMRLGVSYLLSKKMYFPVQANYFLISNCETPPLLESQVRLSSKLDVSGMPRADVSWRVPDTVRQTLLEYNKSIKKALEGLGAADGIPKELLYDSDSNWRESGYSLFHHMGTTRMSPTQKTGVVDEHCKVHGMSNLYVAGTSVFPTGGASNPTFTATALAFRLADELHQQLKPF